MIQKFIDWLENEDKQLFEEYRLVCGKNKISMQKQTKNMIRNYIKYNKED